MEGGIGMLRRSHPHTYYSIARQPLHIYSIRTQSIVDVEVRRVIPRIILRRLRFGDFQLQAAVHKCDGYSEDTTPTFVEHIHIYVMTIINIGIQPSGLN